jgi:hypothetical protein
VIFKNSSQNEGLSPSRIGKSNTISILMHHVHISTTSQDTYFVRHHSDSPYKYSEADIKIILGFLVDNIYVVFGNQVFQQSVGVPMGTNCALLLADLLLYSYEAEFDKKLIRDNNKKTCRVLQPYI